MSFEVSVIVPVYNGGKYLEEAVESAVHLAEVAEIILIEDGSRDNSLAVCEALAANYSKIKLLTHPQNQNKGAAESRNLGVQQAGCDFIAFLDADDLYDKNRFVTTRTIFETDDKVDGVYECVQYLNEDKKYTVLKPIAPGALFHFLLRGTYGHFHTNAITVRKSLFQRTGCFNKELLLHQDAEMWLRMAFEGKLVAGQLAEPVAWVRRHEGNRIWKGKTAATELKAYSSLKNWLKGKPVSLVDRLLLDRKIARFKSKIEKQNYYLLWVKEFLQT